MTLQKIAFLEPDKARVLDAGAVPDLIEIVIACSAAEARINAAAVLATVCERAEPEGLAETRARIRRVCAPVPRLGLSAVEPVAGGLLRSLDGAQASRRGGLCCQAGRAPC
jgi:hypothetical protein